MSLGVQEAMTYRSDFWLQIASAAFPIFIQTLLWQALYGGGGAPGEQGAPKLMNEGAEVSYGEAEAWVLH